VDARIREGLLWAFLGVVLFSFSVPLTKVAVGGFDPFVTATGRAVIASALAILLLSIRRVPFPPRHLWKPILITMLGAVFGWPILLAIALQSTTSAHTAVIAAFMPMTTAIFAVIFTHERVSNSFWVAVAVGTAALVVFSLSRGGLEGGSLYADLLIVGAVVSSSLCYVQGAAVTREMPGWQVISWVVVFSLPVTLPATVIVWWLTRDEYVTTPLEWGSLILLGVSSMYLGFFAWYRGLAMAGVAHGGQVQQLQALLTLAWSALLLGEVVTWGTVVAALVVVIAVAWAQRSRAPSFVAPEE
jgi:drug/metabolite transporter (DMT)-like permease